MIWIIGFLTFVLVLDCLLLILLVLIQLPKKESGLGQAFGSSTTDALFGAGSGNVLTNLTKYAATFFFVLTLSLSMLHARQGRTKVGDPRLHLTEAERLAGAPARPAPTNVISIDTNLINTITNTNAVPATNSALQPPTNSAVTPAPAPVP